MAEFQPPEGLRKIAHDALFTTGPCRHWLDVGETRTCLKCMGDAVLAALFAACAVREDPHMWLGDGSRGGRSLVLRFSLPDLPMPEPGPMPAALAEALAKVRAAQGEAGSS